MQGVGLDVQGVTLTDAVIVQQGCFNAVQAPHDGVLLPNGFGGPTRQCLKPVQHLLPVRVKIGNQVIRVA